MPRRPFTRDPLPRRVVCDVIARGLPEWLTAEAETPGKENPHVALDRASMIVLRRAVEQIVEFARELKLMRLTVAASDIAKLVANSPRQIRYRLARRIGPSPRTPRFVEVDTEIGSLLIAPRYEVVDRRTCRLFVDLRVRDDRYGGLRSVPLDPDFDLPLTDDLDDDPTFREALTADAKRLLRTVARYPGVARRIRRFFNEELRIVAWILRERVAPRRRGYIIEVVRAGHIDTIELPIAAGGGSGPRRTHTAGPTREVEDAMPDIPLLLEDLALEDEQGIPAVIDDIRDVLDATRVSPEEMHEFTRTVNELLTLARGAASLVGEHLVSLGIIHDAAGWTEAQVAAAWNATDTGGFGSPEYLAQVRRRLGKDTYVPLILHARVAAIGRREITAGASEAERAVILAAREGHALRMRAEPPPPLGEWMDGRLELIVRAAAALDLANGMEHPR